MAAIKDRLDAIEQRLKGPVGRVDGGGDDSSDDNSSFDSGKKAYDQIDLSGAKKDTTQKDLDEANETLDSVAGKHKQIKATIKKQCAKGGLCDASSDSH
jgi:hypothetical protein